MAVISFQQIKEIAKQNSETHIIDLGLIDLKLKDIKIPVKVKSFEETIKLKNETKLDKDKLTIEYKPFSRLPKQLQEVIIKDDNFQNVTPNTYIQLVKLSEDKGKIERLKFRERLFSILLHLDMEYKNEDGKTMWEDAGIPNKDYNKLVDLFSDIIQYEIHLELLEVIIDSIRNGNSSEAKLKDVVFFYGMRKQLAGLSEEERIEYLDSFVKAHALLENAKDKATETVKVESEKKTKTKKEKE